jgi:N-acetylmuramoyl-L-alanine amidase
MPPAPRPVAPPSARAPARNLAGVHIVVDPGHGGKDPGAQGRSPIPEKVIVLDIAQEVAQRLRAQGARITMTRDSDRFIELDSRAAVADRTRADLFVSIHADSAKRASASGVTVYISRGASAASRRAAQRIANAVERAGVEFRGIQSAGFRVLVAHARPAVLIECGFLTNRAEAQRLSTAAYREDLASAIADGIADCFAG